MFIDAVMVIGQTKRFSCSITINENADIFKPLDLTPYNVVFKVLGAPSANAKVLLEHVISQVSDLETIGQITDATNGVFEFCITGEESLELGLGNKPIMLELVNASSGNHEFTITEGGLNGEFNRIQIVQV